MMSKQVIDEANLLVPSLRNEENVVVQVEDPFFSLKNSLFSFFETMLSKVKSEDDFMKRIKAAILMKIDGGDVSVPQLMSLLNSLNSDKHSLVDSMLSIFKPAPGTGEVSPLISPKVTNGSDPGAAAFGNLSSKDRSTLDQLARVVQKVTDDDETEIINE